MTPYLVCSAYRIINTTCAVAVDLSVVVGLCVSLLMLSSCALLQLYYCTTVVNVDAVPSEKG